MYFDPGMGSLIIQAVVAFFAVVGGYFAVAKTGLKKFFHKKDQAGDAQAESGNSGEVKDDDEL